MGNNWHDKTVLEVFDILSTGQDGLSAEEAQRRLLDYGPNKLPEAKAESFLSIFFRQFQSPLIYILLAAGLIVFLMREFMDGFIICGVLVFNAVIGSIQEGRAQNTLLALKKFTKTLATVLRDGKEIIVHDFEICPGDVVILQEGEKVPADARMIISNSLKVDESSLTGESEPIHKVEDVLRSDNLAVQDQKNMVFKGSKVVAGNGRAVVVATGFETEIGKISKEIATVDTEIPLKKDVRYLSRAIVFLVLGMGVFLFVSGIFLGKPVREMFAIVVSLSVSAIPEGLPIVMTLVLANGVWRMARRNVLVKKLQAVEALGQAKVIAVDKTGTITKNELMVKKVFANGKFFDIGGIGYEPKGQIKTDDQVTDPLNHQELLLIGKIAAFCSGAHLVFSEEKGKWRVAGDPTEAAMLVLAEKIGFNKNNLEREFPKVMEVPFDYKNKYRASMHKVDGRKILAVAGAPETLLNLSLKFWKSNKSSLLNDKQRKELEQVFISMSKEGMRVVALAYSRNVEEGFAKENIQKLTFLGFLGMIDELRPEVKEATQKALLAGIKVVMITGDHKITAEVIAKEAGIYKEGDEVILGSDIDKFSPEELMGKIENVSVFARVTPEHKIKIIQAYKKKGQVVAMTGDGVNDAPSLVAADLGVAMGKVGTEVAKEAADIVLLDDNFGSIVLAVEEGRNIYKTIKRVILYLFSTGLGEVLTISTALFIGYPLPLLPAQIIWLNLVTDSFLDVALAMEPKEKNLLSKKFEKPQKYLVNRLMLYRIFLMALPMTFGTLYLFGIYFETDIAKALTISFTALAVFQWFNAWNCRSEDKSIFQMNPFSNKFLAGSTVVVITLQLFALYSPIMNKVLHTKPLDIFEWLIIIPVAASIILIEELRKFFYRMKLKHFKN